MLLFEEFVNKSLSILMRWLLFVMRTLDEDPKHIYHMFGWWANCGLFILIE